MGIFRSVARGLLNAASDSRNSTMLGLIFQQNKGFARLAFQQLERCAAERGLMVDDWLIRDAELEVSLNPRVTMGEFLDDYAARMKK